MLASTSYYTVFRSSPPFSQLRLSWLGEVAYLLADKASLTLVQLREASVQAVYQESVESVLGV